MSTGKRARIRQGMRKAALENQPFDWGKFKPTDYVAKQMAKYQQTQPKKQGRNQRGRRPPAMVTIAAKPFDWRKFKAIDYVPVEPEPKHTDPLKG